MGLGRTLWMILGAGLLAACATPGGAPLQVQGDALVPSRLQFVGPRLEPLAAAQGAPASPLAPRIPERLWLVLGHTDGRPAGPAAPDIYLRFPLQQPPPPMERRSFDGFELNAGFIARSLAGSAQPLRLRPEDDGLAVQPADARISRLLLGLLDSLQYPMASVTGLRDDTTGEQLVLLYADRPCRITGRIDLSQTGTFVDRHPVARSTFSGVFAHDIVLPQAGLHWLRVRAEGPGRFQVSRTDAPSRVSVFVLLPAAAPGG